MANFETVGVRLVVLGVGSFERDTKRAASALDKLNRNLSSSSGPLQKLSRNINNVGSSFVSMGSLLTASVTLPLVAATTALVASGIAFEDAFAGVSKTVDGVSDDFGNLTAMGEELRQGIRDLSLTVPIAATELAGVMQVAGQLGVRGKQNLLDFTETAAKLGIATDFTAEQAAISFAKLGNIVGISAEEMGAFISNAGNATVELGNNFAATEPEIVNLGLRLAGAMNVVGASTPFILGLSTAMVSLGIRAEMGGSAVSRIFLQMQNAVASGGDQLAAFADVVGMTESQFSSLFGSDPERAFITLLSAFNDLNNEGKLTSDVLEELNLDTQRTWDVINRLAPNVDLVTEATASANKEWTNQNALQIEFQKKVATTASKIQLLKNNVLNLGITIFDILAPALNKIIGFLTETIAKFTTSLQTSEKFRKTVLKVVGALILLGPALTVVGIALKGIAALAGIFSAFNIILTAIFANPVLLAGIAVFAAAFVTIKENLFGLGDLFNQLAGSVSALGGLLTMFFTQGSINDPLKDAFASLLSGDITGAIDSFKASWEELVWFFQTIFVPQLGIEWAKIKVMAMDSIRELGAWLISIGLPMFLDFVEGVAKLAFDLGEALVAWVAPRIPELLKELGTLLKNIGDWILTDALPVIGKKLIEWSETFSEWVKEVWPELGNNLIGLLGKTIQWIIDVTPGIAKNLMEWTKVFFSWVLDVLPPLLVNLGELLLFLLGWIIGKAIVLAAKIGEEWLPALVDWAGSVWAGKDGKPGLKDKLQNTWKSLTDWIKNDAKDDIVSALESIWTSLVNAGKGIGKAILEGIASGLGVDFDLLENGITAIGDAIKDEFEGYWFMGSPSKLAADMAKNIVDGFAMGLNNNIPIVQSATENVASHGIMDQLTSALSLGTVLGGTMLGSNTTNTTSNSSTFAPTINGVPMQNEQSAGRELNRAWRMAQVTSNVL